MQNKYPQDVNIIAANNGYILKIGCQHFVHEGDGEHFVKDLQKYLGGDNDIVKQYGYEGGSAFVSDDCQEAEMAESGKPKSANVHCPAFSYLSRNDCSVRKIREIFDVRNGTIIVNHEDETVIVTQK